MQAIFKLHMAFLALADQGHHTIQHYVADECDKEEDFVGVFHSGSLCWLCNFMLVYPVNAKPCHLFWTLLRVVMIC